MKLGLHLICKCKTLVFALPFLLIVAACSGPTITDYVVKEGSCPLPENLPKEDIDKMMKFAGEVTGIVKFIGGVKFDTELKSKIKRDYPAADDVNRIYALTFAACIGCRLHPADVKGCAKRFDKIIDTYTSQRIESPATTEAENYRRKLLEPLL